MTATTYSGEDTAADSPASSSGATSAPLPYSVSGATVSPEEDTGLSAAVSSTVWFSAVTADPGGW